MALKVFGNLNQFLDRLRTLHSIRATYQSSCTVGKPILLVFFFFRYTIPERDFGHRKKNLIFDFRLISDSQKSLNLRLLYIVIKILNICVISG